MIKNRSFLIGFIILFSLIVSAFPQLAHASDLFTIPDGDKSKSLFLDALFNTDSMSDLQSSPLNDVIKVFNTCVLMIGGVLAAYALIAGTMSTAHDGEVLGKKWSAMWLPIRTAIGSALIFPSVGGFCAIQIMVIWLIHQGVGLADKIWDQYVSTMPMTSLVAYNGPDKNDVFQLATNMLKSNYCQIVSNNYLKNLAAANAKQGVSAPTAQVSFFSPTDTFETYNQFYETKYTYGVNMSASAKKSSGLTTFAIMSAGLAPDTCGSITFNYGTQSVESATTNFSMASLGSLLSQTKSGVDAVKEQGIASSAESASSEINGGNNAILSGMQSVNEAKIKAVKKMNTTLYSAANTYYNTSDDQKPKALAALYTAVSNAANTYVNDTKSAGSALFNNASGSNSTWSALSSQLTQDGWMYAGSWYMQLYRIQNLLSNIGKVVPTSDSEYYPTTIAGGESAKISGPLDVFSKDVSTFAGDYADSSTNAQLEKEYNNATDNTEGDGSISWVVDKIRKKISNLLSDTISSIAESNTYSDNPIGLAYSIGDKLEYAFYIIGGIILFSKNIPFASGAGIASLLSPLLSMIFLVSNMLTVVLPFMPFFLWLGAVLGWAILCIEAVISAPLWMMIHIHPDGDGVVGRGGAGYGMILSLIMRPGLMILGLVCSLIAITIFSKIVNDLFITAFYTMTNRNGISLLQFPMLLGTYAMALFLVIKKAFSLIHVIPDNVLRWLGVNNSDSVEKSSTGGIQTMMAAKMMDDKVGQMSPSRALDAAKERQGQIDDKKEKASEVKAAEAIKKETDGVDSKINEKNSGFKSAQGEYGDTIKQQNTRADNQIARAANTPFSSMSRADLQQLQKAHEVKAENGEQLLNSSSIAAGSALEGELKNQVENSRDTMQEISKHLQSMDGTQGTQNSNASGGEKGGDDGAVPQSAMPEKAEESSDTRGNDSPSQTTASQDSGGGSQQPSSSQTQSESGSTGNTSSAGNTQQSESSSTPSSVNGGGKKTRNRKNPTENVDG